MLLGIPGDKKGSLLDTMWVRTDWVRRNDKELIPEGRQLAVAHRFVIKGYTQLYRISSMAPCLGLYPIKAGSQAVGQIQKNSGKGDE
jgi:hypothetical protein